MDQQKASIADRLRQANNILVTVSNNPSVDQLASCIGLTLALNKMGKHATAVFSGSAPSTIEFLQPEKTLEKNTDSLRDFIIALDKAKADKLRYKVEDKVVKIFITPYRTSISEKDLEFSQGDFNVDVVMALGVHQQQELDQAITAHGRILHDATVITMNVKPGGDLGTLNWTDTTASSLSELVVELLDTLDKELMDGQMATAFLTGIVAETKRFSNEKTSPNTMSVSAELMVAGANQQLVATKLDEVPPPPAPIPPHEDQAVADAEHPEEEHKEAEDGTLEIAHGGDQQASAGESKEPESEDQQQPESAPEEEKSSEPPTPQIHIDDQGKLHNLEQIESPQAQGTPLPPHGSTDPNQHLSSSHTILQPPVSGPMSGATVSEVEPTSSDPLSLPPPEDQPFASGAPQFGGSPFGPSPASASTTAPAMPFMPPSMTPGAAVLPGMSSPTAEPQQQPPLPPLPAPMQPPAQPQQTLSQLEADVNSPHAQTLSPAPPAEPVFAPPTVAPTIMPPQGAAGLPMPPLPTPPSESAAAPPAESQADLENARNAVMQAIASQSQPPVGAEPIHALNAQPLGGQLHNDTPNAPPAADSPELQHQVNFDAAANPTFTLPDVQPVHPTDNGQAPPPLPPPMMPPAA